MPRLPDATSLGQRPVASGQRAVVGIRTGQVEQAVAGLGETVARAGEEAYVREVKQKDKQDKFSYAQARSHWLKEKVSADSAFDEDKDFSTFEKRYQERMTGAKAAALSMVKDDYDRQMLEQDLAVDMEQGITGIRQKALAKEKDWGLSKTVEGIGQNRASYLAAKDEKTRSSVISAVAESIEGARRRGYISDVQAAKLNQSTAEDYVTGSIEMLPYAQQAQVLRDKKDPRLKYVPADMQAKLLRQAESHLRADADRREAKAQRALNEIDQQISSGIPAKPGQWAEWEGKIKGTPLEAEFGDRVKDEQTVQDVLRLPFSEQMTYVQQKEAELTNSGGSVRDAMNLNRLKTAVNQNLKQLQETPLLFSQARTGVAVEPIDTDALFTPEGAASLADPLTDRVATINSMRKEYGEAVPMRPLLPQEVQGLTQNLAKMTPVEQVELFQSLHKSIGDQKAYEGAMQQIAPDSPVKAMAGVLAGYAGGQTVATHWFREDDKVLAKDAAARILSGESILNKTKADGKLDGNPVSMPIPPETQFYQSVQDITAGVFAGRPKAFQTAVQAIRAYYVGRQAEDGAFNKEIDVSLLGEAVKSTIGEVSEYNGAPVLLPWGMDETSFRDKVAVFISTNPLPEDIKQEIQDRPLVNFGLNSYMVLDDNRRPYLVDGRPLIVDMEKAQ